MLKTMRYAIMCAAVGFASVSIAAEDVELVTPPTPCFGSNGTVKACADSSKITVSLKPFITDCVYLGTGPCKPVTVPRPVVTIGPGSYTLECGIDGPDKDCNFN